MRKRCHRLRNYPNLIPILILNLAQKFMNPYECAQSAVLTDGIGAETGNGIWDIMKDLTAFNLKYARRPSPHTLYAGRKMTPYHQL